MKILNPLSPQTVIKKTIALLCSFVFISLSVFADKNDGPYCTATITVTPGNSTICYGASITLTASGGVSYVWNDGELTSSITVSPTVTTDYIVTGTDGGGCTGTDTIVITVDNPNVTAASSLNMICPGTRTTLSASVEGGTSPFTYAWTPSSWLVCTGCSSTYASPPSTNSYNVVVIDAFGCSTSSSVTVNVDNMYVSTNVTPSTACLGTTAVLTATVRGGAHPFTYLWNPGSVHKLIDSITTSMSLTTYSFAVSDSNGCSASGTATVNIDNISVSLPARTSICSNSSGGTGGSSQLYAQITGGTNPYTYLWSTGNTTAYQSLATLSSGIYSVSVTDAHGCSSTAVDTLTVHSPPVIQITSSVNPIQIGWHDTLTASGGIGYYWSTGQTGNKIIVNPDKTTGYSVNGWDANYCSSSIGTTVIVTRDYFLPSPDTMIHHLPGFPPIYYDGNVSIGGDSAYSPRHALEVHGSTVIDTNLTIGKSTTGININGATATISSPTQKVNFGTDTITTTGNVKAGGMQVGYFKADSIKTGTINLPDSILTIGDPMNIILNQNHIVNNAPLCIPAEFQNCGGYYFFGTGYGIPTQVGIGKAPLATLDIGVNSNQSYQFAITNTSNQRMYQIDQYGNTYAAGNVGIGITSPLAQFQINKIGASPNGNNGLSMGAMASGNPYWDENYIGFNAARSTTTYQWTTGTDGGSNGGAIIMENAGGGLDFATIPGNNSELPQTIGSDYALSYNNIVMRLTSSGELVIGPPSTIAPSGYLLAVNGSIIAKDVMVKDYGSWPDYVFKKDYKLKNIEELKSYLKLNHHLPGLPSAEQIKGKGGVSVEEMLSAHTEKLEELTLYIIQLDKEVKALETENEKLKEAASKK